MVRAKFKVESKKQMLWQVANNKGGYDPKIVTEIELNPCYPSSEENKAFYAATPGGKIMLPCVNPEVADQFVLGSEMYVDFTPAGVVAAPVTQ